MIFAFPDVFRKAYFLFLPNLLLKLFLQQFLDRPIDFLVRQVGIAQRAVPINQVVIGVGVDPVELPDGDTLPLFFGIGLVDGDAVRDLVLGDEVSCLLLGALGVNPDEEVETDSQQEEGEDEEGNE